MNKNFVKNKIFNEDTRAKIPALCHFLSLGYKYISICDGSIDYDTNNFKDLFKKFITKINNKEDFTKKLQIYILHPLTMIKI